MPYSHIRVAWQPSTDDPPVPTADDVLAALAHPAGVDLDLALDATETCHTRLPSPAGAPGAWLVWCPICDLQLRCAARGRPDDPRSVRFACRTFRP